MSDIDYAHQYLTVASAHEQELEIKKSRFLAQVLRTETEEEARQFIAQRKRMYHDARHHCSAFVLGHLRDVQRSNDDGEPAGTAGIPMLEAILQHERYGMRKISDVTVVVTRWFGGIKLGAGGLVRAYSDAVSAVLAEAPLVLRQRNQIVGLTESLANCGKTESMLRNSGEIVLETRYDANGSTILLAIPDTGQALVEAQARWNALLARQVQVSVSGVQWVDLPPRQ